MTSDSDRFARLGKPRRIWAVGAVHGDVHRLAALHDDIGPRFSPGDRLVYLGNLIGVSDAVTETLDEVLGFRRALLALPGMLVTDIVFLRGAQEEMWEKLLQLQFAPNPSEVLDWMLSQGVAETLRAYGGRPDEGLSAARDGAVQLTRWTNRLREAVRARPGHYPIFSALRRAAFNDQGMLCVNANVDVSRPLAAQGDSFWWGGARFAEIASPYETFARIVRGFDPANNGIVIGDYFASLDAGCGRGGHLAAAVFDPAGAILDLIEVP